MFTFVLLLTIASASSAPHHGHHHSHKYDSSEKLRFPKYGSLSSEEDSSHENSNHPDIDLDNYLPNCFGGFSEDKIEGDKYKLTIYLPGSEVESVVVGAKKGLLLIRTYEYSSKTDDFEEDHRSVWLLPKYVNENGTWTLENGLLKVYFPLVQKKGLSGVLLPSRKSDVTKKETIEATTYAVNLKDEMTLLYNVKY